MQFIGTQKGLSAYDGKKILNYRFSGWKNVSWIHTLVQNKNGGIYGLIKEHIFTFYGNKIELTEFRLNELMDAAATFSLSSG